MAVCFYLYHGLVRVCKIELSHIDKNKGNPDLVCERGCSATGPKYAILTFIVHAYLCN